MVGRDIVVVGASAGGIGALRRLAHGLSADLPAALFVVLHIPATPQSVLPEILSKSGPLRAIHARDGASIEPGRIYVAPPDRHLLLEDHRMRVVFGPRVNRFRPAVDPLFESAARVYNSRVFGLILSGTLDDGCNGLSEVKRNGGLAVVQDPAEADFPQLPLNALTAVNADYSLPVQKIAELIETSARRAIVKEAIAMANSHPTEHFSGLTCPDCSGPILTSDEDRLEFRCIVGHSYSPESMRVEHEKKVENALWSAMASLQEHATLLRKVAERLSRTGTGDRARTLEIEAKLKDGHASELRSLIEKMASNDASAE